MLKFWNRAYFVFVIVSILTILSFVGYTLYQNGYYNGHKQGMVDGKLDGVNFSEYIQLDHSQALPCMWDQQAYELFCFTPEEVGLSPGPDQDDDH